MMITTKDLGLAAYIKMNDVELLSVEGRVFKFNTIRTENEWRVDYMNSSCHTHDVTLCELRRFIKK